MTKSSINSAISSCKNGKNLLDNPWFTINQRGSSSYQIGYSVDRWYNAREQLTTVLSNGIKIETTSSQEPGIVQKIDGKLSKGTYTLSVKIRENTSTTLKARVRSYSDWSIGYGLVEVNSATEGIFSSTFTLSSDTENVCFYIETSNGGSYIVEAAKLERGSVCTLANDSEPDYATELLKCQRYFISTYQSGCWLTGRCVNTTQMLFFIPNVMRALPTVSYSNSPQLYCNCYGKEGYISITSATAERACGIGFNLFINVSNNSILTAKQSAHLAFSNITLSADL